MSFLSLNCHHVHARSGQEVGYEQAAGRAHLGMWVAMSGVEVVCPALYRGGDKEKSYTGEYALVSMRSGDAYVVEGVAGEIADRVTGSQSMRRIQLEKLQNVGGNVLDYGGHLDAWVQPDAVEALEKSGYVDQGYHDGVSRVVMLMRSGAVLTLYGVTDKTIATTPRWYRG